MPKVLDVIQADTVTGQVQQAIQQHGAVAVGEYKAVTVGPGRVSRVVLHETAPQHFGDIRHAHGCTGVPGIGSLWSVHSQSANRIDE